MTNDPNINPFFLSASVVYEINRLFEKLDDVSAESVFYLLACLLRSEKIHAVALDEIITTQVKKRFGDEIFAEVEGIANRFYKLLEIEKSGVSYVAMGYWGLSAGEDDRRSVFYRPWDSLKGDRKQCLANAICFYDLTFAALEMPKKLYSVTQYTATKAPDLPGINVEYFDKNIGPSSEKHNGFWHICTDTGRILLQNLGWDSWINQIANHDESQLESILCEALKPNTPEIKKRTTREAKGILEEFTKKRLQNLSRVARAEVVRSYRYLHNHFQNEKLAKELRIDRERACFMLATHLLWNRACPSRFTYTFSVPVIGPLHSKSACTLTFGTQAPFSQIVQFSISSVASAFFINPLIMEYAQDLAIGQRAAAFRASARLLGHNIPNLAVAPCITRLKRIGIDVEEAIACCDAHSNLESLREKLIDVASGVQTGIELFAHYERLLAHLLGSESLLETFLPKDVDAQDLSEEEQMDEGLIPFTLNEIFDPLFRVRDLIRSNYVCGREVRKTLAQNLNIYVPEIAKTVRILEQRSLLQEVVLNLVRNALYGLCNSHLKEDRGMVKVVPKLVANDVIHMDVIDYGDGFGDKKPDYEKNISDVLNTNSTGHFEETVQRLLSKQASQANGGGLGLGLIFCAAYARSREWFLERKGAEGRKGDLIIDPNDGPQDAGAVVRLVLPLMWSQRQMMTKE